MMKKGTLPAGYTVKKRKLVKIKNDKKTKTNVAASRCEPRARAAPISTKEWLASARVQRFTTLAG